MEALRHYSKKIDTSRERRVRMYVGPNQALEWLETDMNNRKLMNDKVDRYGALIRSDDWVASQAIQPVCIDWNGNLIDGQHRLRAIVRTGITVEIDVVFGCDPELKRYIDTGASRTTAQVLYMTEDDPIIRCRSIHALVKEISIKIDNMHRDFSPEETKQLIMRRYYVYKHVYDYYLSPYTNPKASSKYILRGMVSLDANNIRQDLVVAFYKCLNSNADAPQGRNGKAVRDFCDWHIATTKARTGLTAHSIAVPDEVVNRLQKAFYLFANNKKTTSKSGELYPLTSDMLDKLNEKYKAEASE